MKTEDILKEHEAERTKLENYTRVMGYIRPVASFNDGKLSEYKERLFYNSDINLKK